MRWLWLALFFLGGIGIGAIGCMLYVRHLWKDMNW